MSPENQDIFQLQKKETHTSHKTTLIVAVRSVRGGLPEINWKLFINPEGGGVMTKNVNESHANREKKPVLLRNSNHQGDLMNATRCGAVIRKGTPYLAPAVTNGRCRMHEGKSTGPRTPEGLERSRKANFKHGFYSVELLEERKFIRQLLRNSRETLEQVEKKVESIVLSGF